MRRRQRVMLASVAAVVLVAIFLLEFPHGKRSAAPERGPVAVTTTIPVTNPTSSEPNVFQPPVPATAAGLTPHPVTNSSPGAASDQQRAVPTPQIVRDAAPPTTDQAETIPPNTVAPVVFSLDGSCTASAPSFTCRLTLKSSNGLASAGYVSVFPSLSNTQLCRSSGPLVHDSVNLTGTCGVPFASLILAVYSLDPDAAPSRIASAYIAWSQT